MKLSAIVGMLCGAVLLFGGVMQMIDNGQLPPVALHGAAEPSPSNTPTETSPVPTAEETTDLPNTEEAFLMLVNVWNPVAEDFAVDTMELPNGHEVAEECYEELIRMLEDCREAGGNPEVCSGYRTYRMQELLFEDKVKRVKADGYEEAEAVSIASRSVAYPGTSEHHTGLAVDIIDKDYPVLDDTQAERPTQKWLMENCHQYGFVLRYPPEKSDWTGIIYEPWHYRYVGRAVAVFMQEQEICLEELYACYLEGNL